MDCLVAGQGVEVLRRHRDLGLGQRLDVDEIEAVDRLVRRVLPRWRRELVVL
jgi:hypothetical protein